MLRQSVITGLLAKSKPQANSNPIKISNNPGHLIGARVIATRNQKNT